MKIVTGIAAPPQFVRSADLSREVKRRDWCSEVIVHTGQNLHDVMSDILLLRIFRAFYNLGVGATSRGQMAGRMIGAIEGVLLGETPNRVPVCGDTNSTLAGAPPAVKLQIPVATLKQVYAASIDECRRRSKGAPIVWCLFLETTSMSGSSSRASSLNVSLWVGRLFQLPTTARKSQR